MGESQPFHSTVLEIEKAVEFHILIVEDNHSDYRLVERAIKRSELSGDLSWAATAEGALSLLQKHKFNVVLLDYVLPDSTGLALYEEMISLGYDLPVIFVTAMGNEQAAVDAFKLGAQDYLIKDIDGEYLKLLPFVIRKGYQQWEDGRIRRETEMALRELNATLEKKIADRTKEISEREALTRAILGSLNLEKVLEGILEQLVRVVDYQSANVMLLEGDRLDVAAYQHKEGKPQTIKTIQFEDLAYVKEALEQQVPVHMADTSQDSRWKKSSETDAVRCWVGIPLVVQDRTIGLLNLNHVRPNAYSDKLIVTTAAFANQAAIAIENARLYSRATREIEERKRAEKALEAERESLSQRVLERTAELTKINHKLSQAMQAKDQFLANMSHELRTPLTAILGKTEVLQEGIYGSLTEKQIQAVEVIDLSSTHLLALINDILDVARIEAGQLELDWETVALQSLCEAGIQFVYGEARKKGITIHRQYDERVQTIQADNRRLKQILVNLLSNAVKFTLPGGEVGLEVYGDFPNEVVKIMVWDTGIGISEEGKRKLFGEMNRPKPFVQLENTLSRQFPGSGLGLVLVYSLTEMHNGNLHIESTAGVGTRITVTLPLTTPRGSVERAAESEEVIYENILAGQRQNGRVLLGEDNFYTVEGLVDYLTHLGFEVFVANDGEMVVEKAAEVRPDLILMDIQLPKRDGLEAIKMIRSNLGLVNVPIIALTALTMPGDRERCLAAGANEFVSKPFSIRYVTEVIRRLGAMRS